MLLERMDRGVSVEGGRQIVTAMALVWFCYELAGLSWSWIAPSNTLVLAPLSKSPSSAITVNQQSYNLQDVVQYHLFGKQKREVSPPVQSRAVVNAPKTRLNLTLRGLFSAENGSFALISVGKAEEQVYQVGMMINPSTKIDAIHTDSVVLDRGGKLEVLYLEDEGRPANNAANNRRTKPQSVARATKFSAQASAVGEGGTKFGKHRERLLKNPQEAMRIAKIQPIMKQGKMLGYQVNPGGDPKLFNELGFKAGDLVKEVNGVAVDDPAKIGDLMTLLTSAKQLSVTIERSGRLESLQIEF